MKLLSFALLVVLFTSCQKNVEHVSSLQEVGSVADATLVPLKYHAISFTTPSSVPKYAPCYLSFSKALYSDNRVKSLLMTTPSVRFADAGNTGYYKWDYRFVYSTNKATIIGNRKLYDVQNGVTSLISTDKRSYEVLFNDAGYATVMNVLDTVNGKITPTQVLQMGYQNNTIFRSIQVKQRLTWGIGYDPKQNIYQVRGYGIFSIGFSSSGKKSQTSMYPTHDGWIVSQDYGFLEAMQWVPQSQLERSSYAGSEVYIDMYDQKHRSDYRANYSNHKYDANNNLISITTSDNIYDDVTPESTPAFTQTIVWK